jgi:uncharacterized membrane protein
MNLPASSAIVPTTAAGAGRGLQWWASAISWLFADSAQLGVWVLMAVVFFALTLILHFIPLLGSLASFLLHFVFAGGLLLAASKSAARTAPPFGDLFAGFGPRAGQLVAVALLVFVACLAIGAAIFAIGIGAVISAALRGVFSDMSFPDPARWGIGLGTLGLLFLCLLALIPVSMAAWLAPALVMLRGAAPVDALRLSLEACQRNLGALTLYGLVGVFFAILATLLLGLGWLVLLPLAFLSSYAAYQDLFLAEGDIPG